MLEKSPRNGYGGAKNRFSARYLNDSFIYFYLFKKDTIVTLPPLHGGIGNHESDWLVRKTIMLTDDSFMTKKRMFQEPLAVH